jgi:hypothetical protein
VPSHLSQSFASYSVSVLGGEGVTDGAWFVCGCSWWLSWVQGCSCEPGAQAATQLAAVTDVRTVTELMVVFWWLEVPAGVGRRLIVCGTVGCLHTSVCCIVNLMVCIVALGYTALDACASAVLCCVWWCTSGLISLWWELTA